MRGKMFQINATNRYVSTHTHTHAHTHIHTHTHTYTFIYKILTRIWVFDVRFTFILSHSTSSSLMPPLPSALCSFLHTFHPTLNYLPSPAVPPSTHLPSSTSFLSSRSSAIPHESCQPLLTYFSWFLSSASLFPSTFLPPSLHHYDLPFTSKPT